MAGGTRSGPYVVVSHEQLRATFVVEPEGSVLVHGIARAEVARIAIQELLLTLGMSEENLTMEMGGHANQVLNRQGGDDRSGSREVRRHRARW